MMRLRWALALASASIVGCGEAEGEIGKQLSAVEQGKQLVDDLECRRCHEPTSIPSMRDCAGCHQLIARVAEHERTPRTFPGAFEQDGFDYQRATARILHFREVPSLVGVERLHRPEWIAGYLMLPHDLRPRLSETMPRLALLPQQAAAIAAFLATDAPPAAPPPADPAEADWTQPVGTLSPGDPARGAARYRDIGCGACHLFTGATEPLLVHADRVEARSLMLAPDLRHARDRMQPLAMVPWLMSPGALKGDAAMPDLGIDLAAARDLAAFVMATPLTPPPSEKAPERLALLERSVLFEEVDERVFGHICVHCHGEGDAELGDGGPGNTGGFGFRPRGLSFSDYESIMAGHVGDDGSRHSVFEPLQDGTPRLVAALLARQREERGGSGPVRGMPLGLPALAAEDIQLVDSWVAQGHPR